MDPGESDTTTEEIAVPTPVIITLSVTDTPISRQSSEFRMTAGSEWVRAAVRTVSIIGMHRPRSQGCRMSRIASWSRCGWIPFSSDVSPVVTMSRDRDGSLACDTYTFRFFAHDTDFVDSYSDC